MSAFSTCSFVQCGKSAYRAVGFLLLKICKIMRAENSMRRHICTDCIDWVVGPYKINGVPLRRVNQAYVIATSTKIDISGIPSIDIDDSYFAKEKVTKKSSKEDQFFEQSTSVRMHSFDSTSACSS